jgi:hypothetical protein
MTVVCPPVRIYTVPHLFFMAAQSNPDPMLKAWQLRTGRAI